MCMTIWIEETEHTLHVEKEGKASGILLAALEEVL